MTTIRAYTTLEQSKKLAKILPLESADMMYQEYETVIGDDYRYNYRIQPFFNSNIDGIPCWSLAALLKILRYGARKSTGFGRESMSTKVINNETLFIETSPALWKIGYRNAYTARANNLVDACYELILELHELNLL